MNGAKTIYPNLLAELARNNMTVGALADKMGMSRANLYNKMKGKTMFNIKDMKSIRFILIAGGKSGDYSLDHLFKEDGA